MSFEQIMKEIKAERIRQDLEHGEQNHANGTSAQFKGLADSARNATARAALAGQPSWFLITKQVFWRTVAESDPATLRARLVQLVAVGVAWIESIDRQNRPS